MKTLVIAEKPSVAADLAKVLGASKGASGFENADIVINSALGHLGELRVPEADKYPSLPIIPAKFDVGITDRGKKKFSELREIFNRKDIGVVVNACDAGREGELIFHYIYRCAKSALPIKRLWMQSMTEDAIRLAWKNLLPMSAKQGLLDAAISRAEADWLIGINGSRALYKYASANGVGGKQSVGRVQTPTLALIVTRDQAIKKFVPVPYWEVVGKFKLAAGEYHATLVIDKQSRFDDKVAAESIAKSCVSTPCEVEDETKSRSVYPPLLYSLTALQKAANAAFGFSAQKTLDIAQALYETHKATTYPRTDSSYLPEDYVETAKAVLAKLDHSKAGQANVDGKNKRVFDSTKITDHFAIIPTEKGLKDADEDIVRIYKMVCDRFVAVFFPSAVFSDTTRTTKVGEHIFVTKGSVLIEAGWMGVEQPKRDHEELPAKKAGEKSENCGCEVVAKSTKPPAHYTEATLLTAMENASNALDDKELAEAMGNKGLGTPATRAKIIEKLIEQKYIERVKKNLCATEEGTNLINLLNGLKIEKLTSAQMTGEWEHRLEQVSKNAFSRKDFMNGVEGMTREIVQSFAAITTSTAKHKCPKCGLAMAKRTGKFGPWWGCTGYPECNCIMDDKNGEPVERKEREKPKTVEHKCPACGSQFALRTGTSKTGKAWQLYGCTGFPKCKSPMFSILADGSPGDPIGKK